MANRRPGVNDPRQTDQPMKIDRLPHAVHEAIDYLYKTAGKTWDQIADQSAREYSPDWTKDGGGFVNWHELPLAVLELFPEMRLPRTNLNRFWKVRIAQVREATLERAGYARELAESFTEGEVKGDKDAVLYAARDIFFGILAEDGSLTSRAAAGKALLSLAKEQQKSRANDIKERQVAVDERVLQMKLDAIKQKAEELLATADGDGGESQPLSRAEVLSRVKDIYGVA